MAFLRVTGMIPPEQGSYWAEGTLTVWPADRSRSDWADGGRRAAFPITGTLAGGGTRWGSSGEAGDVLIPGADIGVSVAPPELEIVARLRDAITNEWKEFKGVGPVHASAPGEWNINAPLGGAPNYVNAPGVPAGALMQTDAGVAVPSMAQFAALDAAKVPRSEFDTYRTTREAADRRSRRTKTTFTLPASPADIRAVIVDAGGAPLPPGIITPFGTGVYVEGEAQVRVKLDLAVGVGTFHVVEIGFAGLEQNGPLGSNAIAAVALDDDGAMLSTDQGLSYNYLDWRDTPGVGQSYTFHTFVKGWNSPAEGSPNRFDPYGHTFDLFMLLNLGGHYANKQTISFLRVYAAKNGDIVQSFRRDDGWIVNRYAGGWEHAFLPGTNQNTWAHWNF